MTILALALGFAVGAAVLTWPVYYLVSAVMWGIPLTRRAMPQNDSFVWARTRKELIASFARVASICAVIAAMVGGAVVAWGSDRLVLGFLWGAALGALLTLLRMGRARRDVEEYLDHHIGPWERQVIR